MAARRTRARTRQTKLDFSPATTCAPATPAPPKTMRSKKKNSTQSTIDVHDMAPKPTPRRSRTPDSSDDELNPHKHANMRTAVPVRAKSDAVFGSSDGEGAESGRESGSEAPSEVEERVPTKATRGGRKRRRVESSDEEGTVTVVKRKRARREVTPREKEEEVGTPPRSVRRRLTKRPATEEEEQSPPRRARRRARRQRASSDEEEESRGEEQEEDGNEQEEDGDEQEELQEELAFLRSSPLPDRGRLRSTHDKPKNKRQEALEALKRRRAGSTQEPSSTPARKRTVIDSDSESELEVIKEEPDSDELGDPESEVDSEEDDRDANALDMFQEDEDDTGFIDDDPDAIIGEPDDDQPQLPMQFSSMSLAKPKQLFKYAVEWMVMKKIHPAFNSHDEIYELTFRKLGDEIKGLASSKFTSSAWTSDFTKAINARPELHINEIGGARRAFLSDHCEACNRRNHPATFELSLTGQPYDADTLELLETGHFNSDSSSTTSSLSATSSTALNSEAPTYDARGDRIPPESKTFTLGRFCKANAQVAHTLHHWRFHLNDCVCSYLSANGYLTSAKLAKRDRKSAAKREAEARRLVDKMEQKGEIARLHRLYKDQVRFAVEAVNEYRGGWGR